MPFMIPGPGSRGFISRSSCETDGVEERCQSGEGTARDGWKVLRPDVRYRASSAVRCNGAAIDAEGRQDVR